MTSSSVLRYIVLAKKVKKKSYITGFRLYRASFYLSGSIILKKRRANRCMHFQENTTQIKSSAFSPLCATYHTTSSTLISDQCSVQETIR